MHRIRSRALTVAVLLLASLGLTGCFFVETQESADRKMHRWLTDTFPYLGRLIDDVPDWRDLAHPDDELRDSLAGQRMVYRVLTADRDLATLAVRMSRTVGAEPYVDVNPVVGTAIDCVRIDRRTHGSTPIAIQVPCPPQLLTDKDSYSSQASSWGRDALAQQLADGVLTRVDADVRWFLRDNSNRVDPLTVRPTAAEVLAVVRATATNLTADRHLYVEERLAPSGEFTALLVGTATAPDIGSPATLLSTTACGLLEGSLTHVNNKLIDPMPCPA